MHTVLAAFAALPAQILGVWGYAVTHPAVVAVAAVAGLAAAASFLINVRSWRKGA